VQANSFTVMLGRSGAFDASFLNERACELAPISSGRAILGTFGKHSVEVLAVGNPAYVDAIRQLIADRAAKHDETVRWGMASFPAQGEVASCAIVIHPSTPISGNPTKRRPRA